MTRNVPAPSGTGTPVTVSERPGSRRVFCDLRDEAGFVRYGICVMPDLAHIAEPFPESQPRRALTPTRCHRASGHPKSVREIDP